MTKIKLSKERELQKMKSILGVIIFVALVVGYIIFQTSWSKDHHIYLNADNGVYYHDCGYGYCIEQEDENGNKCFYCTHCDEVYYK